MRVGKSSGISEEREPLPVRNAPSPAAVALAWLQHQTLSPPPLLVSGVSLPEKESENATCQICCPHETKSDR